MRRLFDELVNSLKGNNVSMAWQALILSILLAIFVYQRTDLGSAVMAFVAGVVVIPLLWLSGLVPFDRRKHMFWLGVVIILANLLGYIDVF